MHKTTANVAVYLLMGVLPIQAQLDIKILCFFVSLLRRPESIERDIIERQLAMKNLQSQSHSWTVMVRKLLLKYQLPSAFDLLQDPPKKDPWKKRVKLHVTEQWEKENEEVDESPAVIGAPV